MPFGIPPSFTRAETPNASTVRPERIVARGCAEERRVRAPGDLTKPRVEHRLEQAAHEIAAIVADRRGLLQRSRVKHGHRRGLRFRIGRDRHARVLVRRNRIDGPLRRFPRRDAAEVLAYEPLGMPRHSGRRRRRRRCDPVCSSAGRSRGHADRGTSESISGSADRQALRILRLAVDRAVGDPLQPRRDAETLAPFLEDDAALLVDLFVFEAHAARRSR